MNKKEIAFLIGLVVVSVCSVLGLMCICSQLDQRAVYAEQSLREIREKHNTLNMQHDNLIIQYASLFHQKEGFESFGFFAFLEDGREAHITVNHKGEELTLADQLIVEKVLIIALKNIEIRNFPEK